MTEKQQETATEKKPAARARRARSHSTKARSHRRKATPNAQQHAQLNGGGEHEGSDYQTVVPILNRYCAAKKITYGDVNLFEWLAFLQQGGQIAQGRTMAAGQR